jgi:hypothetical protein
MNPAPFPKTPARRLALFLIAVFPALFNPDLLACSTHSATAGTEIISIYGEANDSGQIEIRVGVESTLVEPATTTTCVAGIGLGSKDAPLAGAIQVIDMQIEVADRLTGKAAPIPAFNWAANSVTSAGLSAGSGGTAPGDPNPTIPGATWFGFSSEVEPFRLELGANEFVRMMFVIDMPVTLLPLLTKIQMAAGEGNRDGSPVFDGDHPVTYFSGFDDDLVLPHPSFVFANGFED